MGQRLERDGSCLFEFEFNRSLNIITGIESERFLPDSAKHPIINIQYCSAPLALSNISGWLQMVNKYYNYLLFNPLNAT